MCSWRLFLCVDWRICCPWAEWDSVFWYFLSSRLLLPLPAVTWPWNLGASHESGFMGILMLLISLPGSRQHLGGSLLSHHSLPLVTITTLPAPGHHPNTLCSWVSSSLFNRFWFIVVPTLIDTLLVSMSWVNVVFFLPVVHAKATGDRHLPPCPHQFWEFWSTAERQL